MNKTSIVEVIKRRSSWRSYDHTSSIPKDILSEIRNFIESKNQIGPFGNKARFELIKIPDSERNKVKSEYGTYGFIKGAEYFIAGVIPKNNLALEDFGYLFEYIILKATELNLGTCWLGGTFKRSTIAREINLSDEEILPAITPIGIPQKNRRVLGKIIRFAIRAKVRKPWEHLFFNELMEPISSTILDNQITTALEMVRLAPSAKNKQPWRLIVENDGVVHFFIQIEPKSDQILNYQKLDIGIAMCHFDVTMRNFEKHGKWQRNQTRP